MNQIKSFSPSILEKKTETFYGSKIPVSLGISMTLSYFLFQLIRMDMHVSKGSIFLML